MSLESIVPSLGLCKMIPAGEFGESVLVWCDDLQGYFVLQRPCTWAVEVCPAPTLQEILMDLPDAQLSRDVNPSGRVFYRLRAGFDNKTEVDSNPATAALRLWLKLKGIEVKV